MVDLPSMFDPISDYIAADPLLRLSQGGFLLLGIFILFLLFFALRDILLRMRSFWAQCGCILLVAALPIVGFLLYLLVRPARTIKQREAEYMLRSLLETLAPEKLAAMEPPKEASDDGTLATPSTTDL